jgi:hypothetical protein
MTDAEARADLTRWLAEHGYDERDHALVEALRHATGSARRALTDEERHRVVEAARLGFPGPDVRH